MQRDQIIRTIRKSLGELTGESTPDEWGNAWEASVDLLATIPSHFAERELPAVAKKLGIAKPVIRKAVNERRLVLQALPVRPAAYEAQAHPAIGCNRDGSFWIAGAYRAPSSDERGMPATAAATWMGVNSDGQPCTGPLEPVTVQGTAMMFEGRWSNASRLRCTGTPPGVGIALAYDSVKRIVERYVELHSRFSIAYLEIATLWVLGTYFFPIFDAYPYLTFEGSSGSGKTKCLALLAAVCFNGYCSSDTTPAVLCRVITGARATICLDEVEFLAGKSNDTRTMRSLLNSGYRRGGRVSRVAPGGGIENFDAYSPKALGGIAGLNDVTASRSIRLITRKASTAAKGSLCVDAASDECAGVRDLLYETAVANSGRVRDAYRTLRMPDALMNRTAELYHPLLALAALVDAESGSNISSILESFAVEDSAERGDLDPISAAIADAVWRRANVAGPKWPKIRPHSIAGDIRRTARIHVTPETVGQFFRRLGIPKTGRDRFGAYYVIDPAHLRTELERSGWSAPTVTPPPDSSVDAWISRLSEAASTCSHAGECEGRREGDGCVGCDGFLEGPGRASGQRASSGSKSLGAGGHVDRGERSIAQGAVPEFRAAEDSACQLEAVSDDGGCSPPPGETPASCMGEVADGAHASVSQVEEAVRNGDSPSVRSAVGGALQSRGCPRCRAMLSQYAGYLSPDAEAVFRDLVHEELCVAGAVVGEAWRVALEKLNRRCEVVNGQRVLLRSPSPSP